MVANPEESNAGAAELADAVRKAESHRHPVTVREWEAACRSGAAIADEGPGSPHTVGIIGLGLIGGSLARRLNNAGCRVVAWNHRPHPYAAAQRQGIACTETLAELIAQEPETLVLCCPLKCMPDILAQLKDSLDPSITTLTDVGSVKGLVRQQVIETGLDGCYVGAHPMAGNERSGWKAADPHLFDGALWALTFDDATDYWRVLQVADLITRACRNRLIVVDDETHDRAAAMISHVPHVASTALVNLMVGDEDRNIDVALSAGSWRDMTRVALTDPKRTEAMVEENGGNVAPLLRQLAARLQTVAGALETGDMAALDAFFAEGQPYRDFKSDLRRSVEAQETETIFSSLKISPDHWRDQLLRSAQRGEHIVRFTGTYRAIAEQLPSI